MNTFLFFLDYNGTVSNPLTWEQLQQVLSMFVDQGQLGNFSAILNGKVIGVSVVPPQSINDSTWATINDGTLEGYRILVVVDRLAIHQNIVPTYEGLPFTKQPKIKVLDTYVSIFLQVEIRVFNHCCLKT